VIANQRELHVCCRTEQVPGDLSICDERRLLGIANQSGR
jgi:hypothetical protein